MKWDKIVWFGHVHRKPTNATVRRINNLEVKGIFKRRGRSKKLWQKQVEIILRHSICDKIVPKGLNIKVRFM